MNEKNIQEQYNHIVLLLKQKRLKEAQSQLQAFLWNANNWELQNRLEQAQTSYQYMLQYMKQGTEDPERHKLYTRLLAETWEIADQTRLILLENVSSRYYIWLRKGCKYPVPVQSPGEILKELEAYTDDMAVSLLNPSDMKTINKVIERHETAQQDIALSTWGNSAWTTTEAAEAQLYLKSELISSIDLCLFTSMVTLSLIECFDARKLSWLMDAYTHADTQVNQRALVGIAIILHCHPDRISLYPDLTARLSLLDENGNFGKQLNRVYMQLLYSKETDKINKKMQEEIIPEMIKNANAVSNIMKFDLENSSEDNDRNPDWEKVINQPEFENKMREMNELQMSGADINMSTFAHLKSYPFFQKPYNWFLPFDKRHSSIVNIYGLNLDNESSTLSFILRVGNYCNSDKYSLCLMMGSLPSQQRQQMLQQMNVQGISEAMEDQINQYSQRSEQPETISNLYIHDIYRFFKLNQRRSEFRDPLKEDIALHKIPALKEILGKPELQKAIADFYFAQEHPIEALQIYLDLIDNNHADADLFQKAGYSLQKEKRYKEAIEAYRKADVLKPDHVWTIRHLAVCYRQCGDYASALEYYKKAESIQPENKNIIFAIGSCLAEQERYDEALQQFFKLDFMENNSLKAWRAIGWCSFVSGKYQQAMKHYEKVIAAKPTATDYLNAGHVAWSLGNLEKTCEYYEKSILELGGKEAFLEVFLKDKETLLKQGIASEDIPLVLDLI